MSDRSPMVIAAAREMCRLSAEACEVNNEDDWKVYADEYLRGAASVLDAAGVPELVLALQVMVGKARKQNWNDQYPDELAQAVEAISKATGG